MDSDLFELQSKLVPEMVDLLHERYRVLKFIETAGPIGRRPLSLMADLTERECRSVLEALRELRLIRVTKEGASVTEEGSRLLSSLGEAIDQWSGREALARNLTAKLGIRSVKIVIGDCDVNPSVKNLIGKEAAQQFMEGIGDGEIVAVTGGSSVAAVSPYIEVFDDAKHIHFIAARGGIGNEIGLQANVIAASFAEACGASYSAFYYPESLSSEAHEIFKKEAIAQEMIAKYEKTDCVIHGIGDAQRMAALRNANEEERLYLQEHGAKGEAFGYYFDENGKVVHRIRTVGIQTEQLLKVPLLIAVAGGSSKGEAILAYMASAPKQTILITDEGAAKAMLSHVTNKK